MNTSLIHVLVRTSSIIPCQGLTESISGVLASEMDSMTGDISHNNNLSCCPVVTGDPFPGVWSVPLTSA